MYFIHFLTTAANLGLRKEGREVPIEGSMLSYHDSGYMSMLMEGKGSENFFQPPVGPLLC